jgi:hypothetical protein
MDYIQLSHLHAAYFRSRRKIFKALMHGMDAALQRNDQNQGITVELFLCGMYFVFGRRFLSRFDDPDAFLRMQQQLAPNGKVSSMTRWWRAYRDSPRGRVFGAMYDEPLTRVLWNAMRIAKASAVRSNGLPEIMAALCLDEEVVRDLKRRWGFMPRAYLEPRSSFHPPSGGLGGEHQQYSSKCSRLEPRQQWEAQASLRLNSLTGLPA